MTIHAGIIGLGYVGLPLAMLLIEKGCMVTGVDIDQGKTASLSRYKSYIPDITDAEVKKAVTSGRLQLSNYYDALKQTNVVIICVPTPLTETGEPELRYIKDVGRALGSRLQNNQLVILESSTYPGTTRDILTPLLENKNRRAGTDFYVGYSPERVDPGNKDMKIEEIPKVISGVTEACRKKTEAFYETIFETIVPVTAVETAELSKLLENSYRYLNISFMNEMAVLCDRMNINIWDALHAAGTKPYGFQPFYPGPGAGGHCIPVDPVYLQWACRHHGLPSRFITLSEQTNDSITDYISRSIQQHIKKRKPVAEASILICGISYKKDSTDVRHSPGIQLFQHLKETGAEVAYTDSYVPSVTIDSNSCRSMELTRQNLSAIDCAVIVQPHSTLPLKKILDSVPLVYDTRNAVQGMDGTAEVVVLGGGGMP